MVSLFFTVEDLVSRGFGITSAAVLFVSGTAALPVSAIWRVFLDDVLFDCMRNILAGPKHPRHILFHSRHF